MVLGTPQNLHAAQAGVALARHLHVLSEVPAAISLEQACRASRGLYMMAENYVYQKQNALVRELGRQDLFGEVYYAEGAVEVGNAHGSTALAHR